MGGVANPGFAKASDPLRAFSASPAVREALGPRASNGETQRQRRPASDYFAFSHPDIWSQNFQLQPHSEIDGPLERAKELRTRVGEWIALQRCHRDLANPVVGAENCGLG